MAEKLTKKQKQIVDFIVKFTKENDYSPTYREIMSGLGLSSVSAVAEHVDNLITKGVLRKTPSAARSLEVLLDAHPETVALFNSKLNDPETSEEEIETLFKAAAILELDLEN